MLSPTKNSRIQGLFKAFECFPVFFKTDLIFKYCTFQESPLNSSTFQACVNPDLVSVELIKSQGKNIGILLLKEIKIQYTVKPV